jgi:hypothetical protein
MGEEIEAEEYGFVRLRRDFADTLKALPLGRGGGTFQESLPPSGVIGLLPPRGSLVLMHRYKSTGGEGRGQGEISQCGISCQLYKIII